MDGAIYALLELQKQQPKSSVADQLTFMTDQPDICPPGQQSDTEFNGMAVAVINDIFIFRKDLSLQ